MEESMKILFEDNNFIICVKPVGILSQKDESGNQNMVDMLEEYMSVNNKKGRIYVVHRLDKSVGGVMVFGKNTQAAAGLSTAIQEHNFTKEYLAVINGVPEESFGTYEDLLFKDSRKNKSFVVDRIRKGVKKASLEYTLLETVQSESGTLSLAKIKLHTGRTHQIRVQFASRKMPLLGDGKYGSRDSNCDIALWSYHIAFCNQITKKTIDYSEDMPETYPWNLFSISYK